MITYVIDLPFPVSVNAMYARGYRGGVRRSDKYRRWINQADRYFLTQKAACRAASGFILPLGMFTAEIVCHRPAGRADVDNLVKAVLDFCQRASLIHNDQLATRVTASWGEAPTGCRVTLTGEPYAPPSGAIGRA